jgi:hypothetical protein
MYTSPPPAEFPDRVGGDGVLRVGRVGEAPEDAGVHEMGHV